MRRSASTLVELKYSKVTDSFNVLAQPKYDLTLCTDIHKWAACIISDNLDVLFLVTKWGPPCHYKNTLILIYWKFYYQRKIKIFR